MVKRMMEKKSFKDKAVVSVTVALTLLWTGFIFYNSLQTASESLEMSGVFVTFFINIAKVIFGETLPEGILNYVDLHLVGHIRSMAHIIEFFVLFILVRTSMEGLGFVKRVTRSAFIYGVIVMLTDEFIQIFVDGRGFQIKDLLLDGAGMLIAYVFLVFIAKLKANGIKGQAEAVSDERDDNHEK